MAKTGYTLPVFAVAAAKAALMVLSPGAEAPKTVTLDLMPELVEIPIYQVARLDGTSALGITRSDPGDNLDLTRNTPIWARVISTPRQSQPLILEAGEGLGKTETGEPAIYNYARQLFERNLFPLIPEDKTLIVSIILPEGRQLASRTSNAAFGILEGLALLGTSGISQPLSAADHLDEFRQILQDKVKNSPHLTFCIGQNGLGVAQRLGIPEAAIVQTGNWIGALLVEAGLRGAKSVLLLGYQGKLIKLAGGIFNTSSHIADAKLEILSAAVVRAGGDLATVEAVLQAKTADAAYFEIKDRGLAELVFNNLAEKISQKAQNYVKKYADTALEVDTILFNRQGEIITQTKPFLWDNP
ncbi:MAG: cobalt-precorrin-5B (C(1))-methyltransferase CbiD [Chroococcales cyanobacterium]